MQISNIRNLRARFEVLLGSQSVQAAMMVLPPGETSDEELGNEHPRSEQWVYVVAGNGSVRVATKAKNPRTQRIRSGDVVLIEKGERHQFKNTGQKALRTLNLYSPPAYTANGDVKPKAKGR